MQLILGAAHSRIDCQTDVISRKRLVQHLVHIPSNFPSVGEVVRCIWPTNAWTFDAGDPSGRNKQELNATPWVPNDRESTFDSPVQINLKAGLWVVALRLSRDTYSVYDFPQRVGREIVVSDIGCKQQESGAGTNRR